MGLCPEDGCMLNWYGVVGGRSARLIAKNHTRQWAFALMCPLTPRLALRFTVCAAFSLYGELSGLAQRRQDFSAPEIDHFGNIGAEGNADRNLRESITGSQRK